MTYRDRSFAALAFSKLDFEACVLVWERLDVLYKHLAEFGVGQSVWATHIALQLSCLHKAVRLVFTFTSHVPIVRGILLRRPVAFFSTVTKSKIETVGLNAYHAAEGSDGQEVRRATNGRGLLLPRTGLIVAGDTPPRRDLHSPCIDLVSGRCRAGCK